MRTQEISNVEKNMGLVHKLAHSFNEGTTAEYNDLVGEAVLGYLEAESIYSDGHGLSLNSFAWGVMKNRLINFCMKQNQVTFLEELPEQPVENLTYLFELLDSLPSRCQSIAEVVLANREQVIGIPAKMARGVLVELLREQGWSWAQIWDGMREMKSALNEMA